jgi:hypothetical protein
MNDELRRHLENLTKPEQEQRLKELAESLGIALPQSLGGEEPKPLDMAGYEEYVELKRLLGFD